MLSQSAFQSIPSGILTELTVGSLTLYRNEREVGWDGGRVGGWEGEWVGVREGGGIEVGRRKRERLREGGMRGQENEKEG